MPGRAEPPFSRRFPASTEPNAFSQLVASLKAQGAPLVDLTESNPTHAGLPYSADLLTSLADPAALRYDPHPFGLQEARAAVATDHARRKALVNPDDVVLAASTSEAYGWLFKLLCDPGHAVAVPRPSYPLFEHLTVLEGIEIHPYALAYDGRWSIDFDTLASAPGHTRAVLVVSPNNPTGSYVSMSEMRALAGMCRERGWALIADEVFADYPLEMNGPVTDIARRTDVLTFSLGGFSKTLGLPQLKLAWMVIGGPPADRARARERLELIADTFLSVATPVQVAAARLLAAGASVRSAIHQRIRHNLTVLRAAVRRFPACEVLVVEGGWSAVIRVPSVRSEDDLVLDLLEREHIVVHPGYFFDFPSEAYLVVSLLPEPRQFAPAVERVLRLASA
jgi:hypothetical protein